ncbi:MAG: ankyrin repeat domain-containing protein, partial [Mycobacteriaceae bacterium]|nr:ankyrin repeat domain-containing protein [Mycobacteriaceae bacterium]
RTPMHVAAKNGQVPAIETLVRLGSAAIDTPDIFGCTPIWIATSNGHVAAIETLARLDRKNNQ